MLESTKIGWSENSEKSKVSKDTHFLDNMNSIQVRTIKKVKEIWGLTR